MMSFKNELPGRGQDAFILRYKTVIIAFGYRFSDFYGGNDLFFDFLGSFER